jgi:hypothetical protein
MQAKQPSPSFRMTDLEWKKVADCSALPSQARSHIDSAIFIYRAGKWASRHEFTPASTRKSLKGLQQKTRDLRNDIALLSGNPLATVRLTRTSRVAEQSSHTQNELRNATRALEQLEQWIDEAAKSVVKARPGASRQATILAILVFGLDQTFFAFTNKHIDRSNKANPVARNFVTAVCSIADLEITDSSIDAAMKQVIKSRGEISRRAKR